MGEVRDDLIRRLVANVLIGTDAGDFDMNRDEAGQAVDTFVAWLRDEWIAIEVASAENNGWQITQGELSRLADLLEAKED